MDVVFGVNFFKMLGERRGVQRIATTPVPSIAGRFQRGRDGRCIKARTDDFPQLEKVGRVVEVSSLALKEQAQPGREGYL